MTETFYSRLTIREAAAIVCPSYALKDAVECDLGPDPRLYVIPSASPELPGSTPGRAVAGDSYVLAIGVDLPHKDWDGLVAAFAEVDDLPVLQIVGPISPRRRARLTAAGGGRVHFLGPTTDRQAVTTLIQASECVVAHSHLESFGFVPLEALALGVPVAASDIPAHRETCGNAAYYYRLSGPAALRNAIRRATSDDSWREKEVPGLARTWDEAAADLATVLAGAGAGNAHPF